MVIGNLGLVLGLVLSIMLIFLIFAQTISASGNNITFERVTCKTYPGSKLAAIHCGIKYIDRNNLKLDLWTNVTEPIHDVWIHALPYFRYNTYQRIAVNLWENACDWLSGKSQSYIMDWTVGRILNYSNLNHTCPYVGLIFLKVDKISINKFPLPPIMPAGRYRIDLDATESDRNKVIASVKLYCSISDHRLEIV